MYVWHDIYRHKKTRLIVSVSEPYRGPSGMRYVNVSSPKGRFSQVYEGFLKVYEAEYLKKD